MESRTQGSRPRTAKKPRLRPRTALPRTDPLETKDRNARGQGPRTQAQVFSKKKVFKIFFQAIYKKRSSKKFLGDLQNFNDLKNRAVFEPRQDNFRGLETLRLRNWPSRPKPRTSKCVLEAKNFLEDSIFVYKSVVKLELSLNLY